MAENVTKGKLVHKEGKYFLDVAGKMEALPTGFLTDEAFLKEQVGKDLEVFLTIPKPFVAALRPIGKPVIILCNIPRPDYLRGANLVTQPSAAVTRNVATVLLNEGFITKEVHDTIVNSYAAGQ
jgi:hypothetical protein